MINIIYYVKRHVCFSNILFIWNGVGDMCTTVSMSRTISWSCFLSFTFTWVSRITLSLHMCAAASALPTGHLSARVWLIVWQLISVYCIGSVQLLVQLCSHWAQCLAIIEVRFFWSRKWKLKISRQKEVQKRMKYFLIYKIRLKSQLAKVHSMQKRTEWSYITNVPMVVGVA